MNCVEVVKLNKNDEEIIKELFPKNFNEMIIKNKLGDIDIYTIKVNGVNIGKLNVDYKSRFLDGETYENRRVGLSWMHIIKEYRGKGYSSKLLEYVINKVKSNGYKEITVCVEPLNTVALNLYRKFGFITKIGSTSVPFNFDMYLKEL